MINNVKISHLLLMCNSATKVRCFIIYKIDYMKGAAFHLICHPAQQFCHTE